MNGLLLCALLVVPAQDDEEWEPADASVTNTLIVEARGDNKNGSLGDDEYIAILERMNLSVFQGDFEGWGRIDGGFFFPYADKPLATGFAQNLQLERIGVAWTLGDYKLTVGDMFQQLGRGIVLAIRKVNEAGIDVALRGVRIEHEGETFGSRLFVGITNPANIDSVNQRFVADPNDLIAGGGLDVSAVDGVRVGVFGSYLQPVETLIADELDLTVSAGSFIDAHSLLDWLSVYGEADVQYRRLAGGDQVGSALYGTATANLESLTLVVESMWLAGFEQRGSTNSALGNRFSYNVPPTLERIDQEVANNRDVLGLRARAEYYLADLDLLLYANGVHRINEREEPSEVRQYHGFGGFLWNLPGGRSRLGASSGFRDEALHGSGQRVPLRTMWHLDLDWLQSLGGGVSIHTTTQMQFWELQGRPFDRGSQFVGIEKAGLGGVTFELGVDTQNQSAGIQNFFYAGIVSWELPPAVFFNVVDAANFRGSLGSQRGGLKCVAGVCREFPAFSGGRGELVLRF